MQSFPVPNFGKVTIEFLGKTSQTYYGTFLKGTIGGINRNTYMWGELILNGKC